MPTGIVNYETFVLSALIFAITPGIDTVFVLNKALADGRRAAVAAAAGVNTGILVHTAVAALGLSALLATCSQAFVAVKLAGAAYLVWLGICALRSAGRRRLLHEDPAPATEAQEPTFAQSFRSGLVTNILNPKVALFVLAFFPQFMSAPESGAMLPFAVLGLTYTALGLAWYLPMAWCAGSMARMLRGCPSFDAWLNRVSGAVFIALGLRIAVTDR